MVGGFLFFVELVFCFDFVGFEVRLVIWYLVVTFGLLCSGGLVVGAFGMFGCCGWFWLVFVGF